MKLSELKTRFKNKYMIRIVAGVLVVMLVGSSTLSYQVLGAKENEAKTVETVAEESEDEEAEKILETAVNGSISTEDEEIGKLETVYIITDSTGTEKEIIVSEHLINNDDKDVIKDASTLKDIVNVKGEESFTQNGEKLTWQANGNDIFYQGTSTEKPPVSQKITYYLDGKEISPEELAGKSGEVTIRYDFENKEKIEATIQGKKETIYVPFVSISGMVLDDRFSNIRVTNGKLMADGDKTLVLGYTLPGLKESLKVEDSDFEEDVTIPDYFEVTADVENFSLDTTMTFVMNATDYLEKSGDSSMSEVEDMLTETEDAMEQLQSGSAELAEGVGTLNSNLGEFSEGVSTLKDGVKTYTEGAQTLADGIEKLSEKTPELASGVNTLNNSAVTLYDGVKLLDKTVGTAFTEEEKETLGNQVSDMLANQEMAIKESAKESVEAQANSIKNQAELAVDAQAEVIKQQAEATVNEQTESIKNQAEAAVDEQTEAIRQQAEATVDAQAEAIRQQAEATVDTQAELISQQAQATVDAQAEAISQQAEATVEAEFTNGQYTTIKQQASEQLGNALLGASVQISDGIRNSDAYAVLTSGVKVQIAAQMGMADAPLVDVEAAYNAMNGEGAFEVAARTGADGIVSAMAESITGTVVPQIQEVAGTAVADAAYTGAKSAAGAAAVSGARAAAGTAAVSGAKTVAGVAAVSGAKSAAGMAAVSGAKSAAGMAAVEGAKGVAGMAAVSGARTAAGTAAVSGAKSAAEQAAYEGAKGAAATAAVSAAEQTKQTIVDSINQKGESGYSLVSGMEALTQGTQTLADSVPELVKGVTQLNDGGKTLVANNQTLNDGTESLNDGTTAICDGVKKINDGANQLADGIVEFNEQGIQKIIDAYNGDIEPLIDRMQAVFDAGEAYQSYTAIDESVIGSVKFIYKTEFVRTDEHN